jgi:pimeloyl-ACP methyl ester carboxylesterase
VVTAPVPDPATLRGIATRFLDVDGVAVHVGEVAGDGGHHGRGVVLLHHFYGNVATWRRVLRRLDRAGLPAVAVDRPGFGWTQRPEPTAARAMATNPYTRAFGVAAARAAVDSAGWDEVVVVGSSMGGTLAIELAAAMQRDPDAPRLPHLVLLAPALTGDVGMPPPLRPVLRHPRVGRVMAPVIHRLSRRMDLDRVAGGWHDRRLANEADVDAYRIPTRLPGWAHGIWEVMTVEPPPDLREVAVALDVPTTVVSGRHDRTIRPRWNEKTAAGMDADLVVLDAGHTPQEEAPDQVADLIVARTRRDHGARRAFRSGGTAT